LPLHARLAAELLERGALEEARREFARIASVKFRERVFDPEGYRRLKGARDLDAEGRLVLRALYLAREDRARSADRPPFKVLGEQAMVELARVRPRTEEAVRAIPGVTPSVLRRMGDAILTAVRGERPSAGDLDGA
jgi:ribonuclease D